MASNVTLFPASFARSVAQAVAAAVVGTKSQAGCALVASTIGPAWRLRLRRGGSIVLDVSYQSAMVASGGAISIPAYTTLLALVAADLDTSTWTCRLGKADESAYVEGAVGRSGSGAPFQLADDLSTSKGVAVSGLSLRFSPSLDQSTSGSAVDQMVAHMTPNLSTVVLNGPPNRDAMKGGYVVCGGDLRSAAVPTWWGGSVYYPPTYAPAYWLTLQPWYVVWDMVGHQAGLNVYCAIRRIELLWLSSDAPTTWVQLSTYVAPPGDAFTRDVVNAGGSAVGELAGGGAYWGVQIDPANGVYHGYQGQVSSPSFDPSKIVALQVRVIAAKVIKNSAGPDQRAQARYAVQAGLDAYPYAGAPLPASPNNYWPGCVGSRFEEMTNDWKAVYATPITMARAVDNSSRAGSYNSRQAITEAALRAAAPSAAAY